MYEEAKLSEATYFYSRMMIEIRNPDTFLFNLSAFLSSARSVLQYTLKEAEYKPNGKQWYEAQIFNDTVLGFFRDKRDINIHSEPVRANQHVTVELTGTVHISGSLQVFGSDGKVIYQSQENHRPEPLLLDEPIKVTHRYTFPDWSGNEDIPTICQMYLDKLRRVVQDGLTKGIISK